MMPTPALYDTLRSFKDLHKVVLNLANDLTDEQLNWKPEGHSVSIGFHLWHLARESDDLKAVLLRYSPQFLLNRLVFLSHECRHSGRMKCLKG
jgi:hypothetical protein